MVQFDGWNRQLDVKECAETTVNRSTIQVPGQKETAKASYRVTTTLEDLGGGQLWGWPKTYLFVIFDDRFVTIDNLISNLNGPPIEIEVASIIDTILTPASLLTSGGLTSLGVDLVTSGVTKAGDEFVTTVLDWEIPPDWDRKNISELSESTLLAQTGSSIQNSRQSAPTSSPLILLSKVQLRKTKPHS